MPSAARTFLLELTHRVSGALDGAFKPHGGAFPLLRRATQNGFIEVGFTGSNKYSPLISIALSYSRVFSTPYRVPGFSGKLERLEPHIGNLSYNYQRSIGLAYDGPYTWRVDIRTPPPDLPTLLAEAITKLAIPFADRFPTMIDARDALERNDSWCIGGWIAWHAMLGFDFALGDLEHFRRWSEVLEPIYKKQADQLLAAYESSAQCVA